MNEEEEMTKEFMKRKYPELVDFDNLQFVKDCEECGIQKYKVDIKRVLCRWEKREEEYIKKAHRDKPENEKIFLYSLELIKRLKKELGCE